MIRLRMAWPILTLLAALAPAAPADPPPAPTLDDAIRALYARERGQAAEILSAIRDEHDQNGQYFLVYALSRVIAGPGREHIVISALDMARNRQPNAPYANAILALTLRSDGQDRQVRRAMQLAERHLAGKPAGLLLQATDALLQREWRKAAESFKALAETDNPFAAEAARRHRTLERFIAEQASQEEGVRIELARHDAQRRTLQEGLDAKEDAWKKAKAERENLRRRYERQRADVEQEYRQRLLLINAAYDRMLDDADEIDDPDDRDDAEDDARRWQRRATTDAYRKRQQAYEDIDRAFAPSVKDNKRTLKQLERDARNLQADLRALEPRERRLRRSLEALQEQTPFGIDAYWREVALWLGREALERPDLPGPKPDEPATTPAEPTTTTDPNAPKVTTQLRSPATQNAP